MKQGTDCTICLIILHIIPNGNTFDQISIIARPQDWKSALREIADADQISPEYGGTGARQEDLPSLADALYAAGSRHTPSRRGKEITQPFASSPTRPVVTSPHAAVTVVESGNVLPRFAVGPGDEEEAKGEEENVESSNRGSAQGWFGSVPGISFSWWGWGEGNVAPTAGGGGTKQWRLRDREASNTTNDEEVRYVYDDVTFKCFPRGNSAFIREFRSS